MMNVKQALILILVIAYAIPGFMTASAQIDKFAEMDREAGFNPPRYGEFIPFGIMYGVLWPVVLLDQQPDKE